ncbi:MAG: AAA family ATPase [Gammaproteobacteria bacterium]|nr:AAA family ATPase [Gammaproteobacteria bacterium]
MSRLKCASTILEAADRWKKQCLLDGGSLFSDEMLWTKKYFDELQKHFVENLDTGTGTFMQKLQAQLDAASPEAKSLWAEMTWIYYLIVGSVKGVTKLDRIKWLWEWSGAMLPEHHWALGEVLDKGFVNPGRGYSGHQWREFCFIITTMLDWWELGVKKDRELLLNDPWRFAEWVYRQKDSHHRQFPHAMLFLLFPDEFEPMMSLSHKKDIVKHFHDGISEPHQISHMDLVEIDKALLTIRGQLEDDHQGKEIHFYQSPWKERWQGDSPKANDDDCVDEADDEAWYKQQFGTADVWVIAPGEGARLWGEFIETGIVAIGWDNLGDLSEYESKEAINSALIENGAGQNPTNQSLAAWEFIHEVRVGDFVLAKKGRSAILGWGLVTGNYAFKEEREEHQNVRTADWHACRAPITLNYMLPTKTLTRFTAYKGWLRSIFELINADTGAEAGKVIVGSDGTEDESYDLETAMHELFMEETQFCRILDQIALRKNLILQGPPGVGKTFIARRIAWCLMRKKDSKSIGIVQFHQSYAYEDFVQGWRPTETGGFTLRNGMFYEFCKLAEDHPEKPFVFIIDEINRGNLSRIFGELLMLIEADKRGPKHAITLTYSKSGDRFSVPENVHILGLMNTADRSLAIVDYALRRRFAFETLEPAFGTEKFREYLLEADVDRDLVSRIDRNLSEINNRIRNDKDLGSGFQIGHSYFVPEGQADEQWYLRIVETQIVPLLHEYWFDRPTHVDELTDVLQQ